MMYRFLSACMLLAGLTAGAVAAQTTASGTGAVRQRMAPGEAAMLGMRDLRVAADLNLTADQQAQIRAAFKAAAEFRTGMVGRGRDLRNQLAAAIKAGDQAKVEKASQDLGELLQQQIAFQAKTIAKVYALLTPEQKTKLDQEVGRSLGLRERRSRRQLGL